MNMPGDRKPDSAPAGIAMPRRQAPDARPGHMRALSLAAGMLLLYLLTARGMLVVSDEKAFAELSQALLHSSYEVSGTWQAIGAGGRRYTFYDLGHPLLSLPATPVAVAGAVAGFALRFMAMRYGWQLPVARART